MKTLAKKLMAFALCLAMVLGLLVTSVGATQSAPKADESADKVIYATDSKTTYVPAGYTYVYQSTDGRTYTRKATQDTYISGRTLSATEAKALVSLSYGAESTITTDDGKTLVCREYDAAEAAAYSDAVKAILSGEDYDAGDKITIVSDSHEKADKVKVIILLDEPSVSEMDGMTVALGKGLGQAEQAAVRKVKDGQTSVISAAKRKLGGSMEVTGQFSLVTNAIAATVSYGDMETLSSLPGVKKVFLSPCYSVPEINAVEKEASQITTNMKFAASGMGANAAWDAGFDGTGMSVAVIDTGLCYENPTFDKEPTDSDAVAYSKDDIAAILAAKTLHAEELDENTATDTVYYSSKVPFGFNYGDGEANFGSDDDTWMGHGTHVAGIIAGNLTEADQEQFDMTYLGIAPEAQLIVMKVFDQQGNCYFDYLIAAIEDAIALGVDCANLSLGISSGPYYYEGVTEVYDAATAAGISVCVSAGNDGFTGTESLWGDEQIKSTSVSSGTLGMPGTFDSVLTVASAENEGVKWLNDVGTLGWFNKTMDMDQLMSISELDGVPEGKGFYENLRATEQLVGGTYAYTESIDDSEGKIVFVPFEGGNGDAVIAAAKAAGAAGVVFYDPTPTEEEKWAYVEVEVTSYDVPAARANLNEFSWMKDNNDTGVVSVMADWNRNNLAGEMSSFSSWGPTEGLSLKPEITGIGGNVFSAYYGNNFAVASGTSMSSPAVAASMALLRQYLKKTSIPEADYATVANCLLMSTATPIVDEANGTYYFVRRQGAGLANVGNAVKSGAYITVEGADKAKLELGDDKEKTGTYEMTFSVVNFSDVDKTYALTVQALGQAAEGGLVKGGKVTYLTQNYAKKLDATYTTSLTDNKLTVPAGATAKVTVTLQLTDAQKAYYDERFENGAYVEGFVQLTSTDSVTLSVPFLAFYGDFGAAPVAETGSYATTMGGDRAYNTADQVVTGIYSYRSTSDDPMLNWMTEKAWLGGTRAPGYSIVPMDDFKFSTMSSAYKGFLPQTAGISPNSDFSLDEFCLQIGLLRNVDNIHYTVTNLTTGEILSEQDTEFMQKSFAGNVYAGGEEDFDMDWFYAKGVDEDGEEYIDYSKCALPENTRVSVKAEITPECKTAQTQTVEFTFYVDTTGPMSKKPTFGYKTEDFGWGPESMYSVTAEMDEFWWMDYDTTISIDVDAETGEVFASAFTTTYFPNPDPNGEGVHSINEHGSMMFEGTHTEIIISYDYAGNCSAYTISGSLIEENMSLASETDSIYIGDELTIRNTDTEDYTALLNWEVSDPEIAEIVTSDDSSVTVKGLKRGDVVVTASIGEFKKSITIHVLDKDYENQKYISLTSETDTIYIGDELMVKNAAADEHPTHMTWTVSDPAIAEIVASDDSSVTIKGLKYGDVTVTGGTVDEFKKSITIHVRDKSYEDLANGFQDISGHWAEKTIVEAVSSGLFNGASATEFDPDSAITRAMFVTVLYRMDGEPAVEEKAAFTDVADGSYYAAAVAWAAKNGIVNGVSETSFDPDASITREQMAAILYRYASYCKVDVSAAADLSGYADASAVSDYAKTAMQWVVAGGVMNGTSATTLDPSGTATRAQAATVLVRFQTGIKN